MQPFPDHKTNMVQKGDLKVTSLTSQPTFSFTNIQRGKLTFQHKQKCYFKLNIPLRDFVFIHFLKHASHI